jgi:hypothetical protein
MTVPQIIEHLEAVVGERNWEEVADHALAWAIEHATEPSAA